MSDKRILEFETATEAGSTDFVAIDSLAGGTRKIAVTDLPGGGGGGGTTVVPNPVGEPTDELETIRIGSTIFSIPGSGGGTGDAYSTTLLYDSGSDTIGAPVATNINLLDNLSNYDMGVIMAATYNDRNTPNDISASQFFFDVDYVLGGESVNKIHLASYGTRWCLISFTDTTFNVERSGGESGGFELSVYKIYGVKFGGGGAKTSITTLYNTFINSVGEITLANNVIDYDFIMIDFGFSGTDKAHNYMYIPAEDIPNKCPYVSNPNNTNPHIILNPFDDQYARMLMGSANNKLYIFEIGRTVGIYGIYGIKYGGGVGRELLYTLDAGASWRTFTPPNNTEIIIVETMGGYGIIDRREVNYTKLPSRSGGDNYVTVLNIPNAQGQAINMATNDSKDTIYISTAATYDMTNMYVKVYAKQGDY